MITDKVTMRTFVTGRSGTDVSRSTRYTLVPCDDAYMTRHACIGTAGC